MKDADFCSPRSKKTVQELLATVKKKSDFQRVQCVWLRAEMNLKAETVAKITNLRPGTVRKIWSDFQRDGESVLLERQRGGRRNSYLAKDEEALFLKPFFKKANQGHPLNVAEIQEAYEELIGKSVPKSTIYRLLTRNGWNRKTGRNASEERKEDGKTNMHDYWIEGCAQTLHPKRTGNISQQWLNQTLNSMVGKKTSDNRS